jgi:PadR family transcriptional regulator AphA
MIYLNDIFVVRYMSTGLKSFHHFILGLLTQRPMSGYDIKRLLKSLGWLVGSPSFGAIYPALHALLQDRLVTVTVLSDENKPPRKIYTITQAGERALHEWIHQPSSTNASTRAFAMRLILADQLSNEGLIAHLQQRRAQVDDHRAALKRMNDELDGEVDAGRRLTLDYGMAIASAELNWLEGMLERLSEEELPEGSLIGALSKI